MVNVVVWCGKLNTNDDEKEAGGNGNVVMMEDDEDSLDGEKNKRDNDRDAWGEKGCDKASEGKTVQILWPCDEKRNAGKSYCDGNGGRKES